ncbi:MAG: TolC family protein [Deferribacteres bacterium]|nr:TolC family protein [candidate division KSB1 bacterium]MCB9502493.1 TolC family protein [Deferribacteres bacterium]
MNRGIILFILLAFLIQPVSISGQTLEAYLQQAAENNPGLKAKYIDFEIALQKIPQMSSLPDPSLSFGYFVSPVETRVGPQKARLELNQMFPWLGTLAAQKDAASLSAEAQYQTFIDAKNELYYQVTTAYYPLYEAREMVRLQEENLDILTSFKQLATTAFSNAKGSMVDVIRADIMIDNTNTDIAVLKEKLKPLQTAFNRLLNRPDSSSITIAEDIAIDLENIAFNKDTVLFHNPQLKAFDLKLKESQAQEKAAFRNGLPRIGIGLSYVFVDKRPDVTLKENGKDALMPMISMTLPLFRKKYTAAVKEAQLKQMNFKLQKQNMENSLVSAFESTVFQVVQARRFYELNLTQIAKTRQAIDLLATAYSNSGKDFDEVLRMQLQLLKYEMARATAVKDYYTAVAKYNYLSGFAKS